MNSNTKYPTALKRMYLLLVFVFCVTVGYGQTYGLKFKGQDVTLDKRTELNITPDKHLPFQDEFEVSFDYKIDLVQANSVFGYVFRIVNEDNLNVDLLSTPSPTVQLNLVIGKTNTKLPVLYPANSVNNWINLRIKFLLSEDRMVFYMPDTFYVHNNIGFKQQDAFKIVFGANDFGQFKTSDVPSMNIKNLKVFEKGKLKLNWLLDESEGNIATDKVRRAKAITKNPGWLKLSHQSWQKQVEEEIEGLVMFANDPATGRVFFVGQQELTIYWPENNKLTQLKYSNTMPQMIPGYKAIYNKLENKIYCYLFGKSESFVLDINSGEWQKLGAGKISESTYRHHNSYFNAANNSVYLFGGYGLHKYYNQIRKLNLTDNSRTDLPNDNSVFTPRYLAGLGETEDTLYLLGGYGSQTGDQLINPHSYFDLIAYSINDGKIIKKFEIPHLIDDMIVANTMWIDEENRDYYALINSKITFDGELQMIKGSLDYPDVELVGNTIPYRFLDVRSVSKLFYTPVTNKLYAYTSYFNDSSTEIEIYSIDNPPNVAPEVLAKSETKNSNSLYYIGAVLLVLLGLVVWILRKKKSKKQNELKAEAPIKEEKQENAEIIEHPEPEHKNYNVILFGGFQVFNKEFEDITNKFSPLLKELFLLILLHTYKNDKGISSDKITEVLWYDKSEKSARNNRAVNIAKLRSILEEVGPCELSKKTGYWKIHVEEHRVFNDYADFLTITASKNNLTKQKVNQLIDITEKGPFLSNVHYEWLDDFKASVSDSIIDTLVEFGQTCDINKEAEFVIHLADSIFNFDVINEDAMVLKCKAQYRMGKHSHAKGTYEKFFKEYMSMYGQEYEKSFLDILEIK